MEGQVFGELVGRVSKLGIFHDFMTLLLNGPLFFMKIGGS